METAQDLFHLIHCFGKNENITNFVNMWMLEDPIQKNQQLCLWSFSIVFWQKPFFPDENSKLHSYKKLTNTGLETLLNELFILNPKNNEQTINEYIKQRQISMTRPTLTALCQSPILVYLKLLTLDRFSLCNEQITNTDKTNDTFFW